MILKKKKKKKKIIVKKIGIKNPTDSSYREREFRSYLIYIWVILSILVILKEGYLSIYMGLFSYIFFYMNIFLIDEYVLMN